MKKTVIVGSVLIFLLSIGTIGVLAAENLGRHSDIPNGICENQSGCTNPSFIDEDQDGICDNREDCNKSGFTDENQDGICDHRQNGGKHHGKQHGKCRN